MSNQKDLLQFYESIILACGCILDEDGAVSYMSPAPVACTVNGGRRLTLPYENIIRGPNNPDIQIFHPMCEAFSKEPSPVHRLLRNLAIMRLNDIIAVLMTELMSLAVDHDRHSKLSPEQGHYLTMLPDVGSKTLESTKKVVGVWDPKTDKKFVDLVLKKGGQIGGIGYVRTALISFPVATREEEDGKHPTVFGVAFGSKKDRAAFMTLANYILPNMDTKDAYSVGSKSSVAPYFDVLMRAFARLAAHLNSVIQRFQSAIPELELLYTDLGWVAEFNDLTPYVNILGKIAGNEGDVPKEDVEETVEVSSRPNVQRREGVSRDRVAATTAPVAATATDPLRKQIGYRSAYRVGDASSNEPPLTDEQRENLEFKKVMQRVGVGVEGRRRFEDGDYSSGRDRYDRGRSNSLPAFRGVGVDPTPEQIEAERFSGGSGGGADEGRHSDRQRLREQMSRGRDRGGYRDLDRSSRMPEGF